MPARHLPAAPSPEHLRKQAKDLLHGVRSGDPAAVALVRELHPRVADGAAKSAALTLADAQVVVARQHGFPSWPRLREYLDVLARFSRSPHRQPVGGPIAGPGELVDEFLRLACLTYGVTDGADDLRRPARAPLDAHPELATTTIHTVAAVGEVATAREPLAADPSLANREGGPYGWPPLQRPLRRPDYHLVYQRRLAQRHRRRGRPRLRGLPAGPAAVPGGAGRPQPRRPDPAGHAVAGTVRCPRR